MLPTIAALGLPWQQCNLWPQTPQAPQPPQVPVVQPAPPKREEVAPRETLGPKHAAPSNEKPVTLPDEVIVKALDAGQALFMRCFKKANTNDPTLTSAKVRLHIELDALGTVVAASSDAEDPDFAKCLERVAHMLPFPAPKKPAIVDLPLFFRAS
jgi:hypothetical protein